MTIEKADVNTTIWPARSLSESICWAIVKDEIAVGAANIIISVVSSTPLYPNIIHIGSMIHGVNIVFPTTAIVVCFRYFFILSNLKDAPSSISESGVAIFETSLIVFLLL